MLKPERASLHSLPLIVKYLISAVFLCALIAIAYFAQNKISADTTNSTKKKVTIAVNNWDKAGQALFRSTFGDTKKFRCSTVDVYLNSDTDAERKKAAQAVAQASGLSVGGSDLTATINGLSAKYNNFKTDQNKSEALSVLNKTAIVNSTKTGCDRGGESKAASEDYTTNLTVPAAYQQPASNTSVSPSSSSTANSIDALANKDVVFTVTVKNKSGEVVPSVSVHLRAVGNSQGTVEFSKQTTDSKGQAKITQKIGSDGGKSNVEVVAYSTDGKTKLSDLNTYILSKLEQEDFAISLTTSDQTPTTQNTSDAAAEKLTIKRISVYLKDGDKETQVKSATIIGTYTNDDEKKTTLAALNSKNTGDKNYLENIEFSKPSDSTKHNLLSIVAKKRNKSSDDWVMSDTRNVRFSNNDEIKLVFPAGSQIDADAVDTSTAQPAAGQVLPTTSNNFPWGKNTAQFTVVRATESMENGWAPVGGVEFELSVLTKEKPQKTSFVGKVLAAETSTQKIATSTSPYNSEIVIPYTQNKFDQLKTTLSSLVKDAFQGYNNYSFTGSLPDNGTQTVINLQNLPSGLYTLWLSKSNFKTIKYLFTVTDSNETKIYTLGRLPIVPQRGAEPPSIGTTDIIKTGNSDYYKAILSGQGYLYNAKFPWKGWQKMSNDSADNYGFDTSVPSGTDETGMPEFNGTGAGLGSGSGNIVWVENASEAQATTNQFIQCVNSQAQSQLGFTGKLGDILAGIGIYRIFDRSTGAVTFEKIAKEAIYTIGVPMLVDALFGTNIRDTEITVNLGSIYNNCMNNVNATGISVPISCKSCVENNECRTGLLSGNLPTSCSQCRKCLQNYPILKNMLGTVSG